MGLLRQRQLAGISVWLPCGVLRSGRAASRMRVNLSKSPKEHCLELPSACRYWTTQSRYLSFNATYSMWLTADRVATRFQGTTCTDYIHKRFPWGFHSLAARRLQDGDGRGEGPFFGERVWLCFQ
ncbi:hypothetical protein BX600DRAFT_270496 [Xylariales sp. PMI_506]|nr:hypothetical protein BX600DRAFT_270496 [Xylariales sp. PMI_506]